MALSTKEFCLHRIRIYSAGSDDTVDKFLLLLLLSIVTVITFSLLYFIYLYVFRLRHYVEQLTSKLMLSLFGII
jgi:hypothetical protein